MIIKLSNSVKLFLLKWKLILIISLISIYSCKKSNQITANDFIGTWKLGQLVIDGHDTTNYILNDSNCYGYTKMEVENITNKHRLSQIPAYYPDSNFNPGCAKGGEWDYLPTKGLGTLLISYNGSAPINNTGPYLSSDAISWNILSVNSQVIKLSVIYQNMQCYLTLNRIN